MILPDAKPRPGRYVIAGEGTAVAQLDGALAQMRRRYGPMAVRLATIGLEYDPPISRPR